MPPDVDPNLGSVQADDSALKAVHEVFLLLHHATTRRQECLDLDAATLEAHQTFDKTLKGLLASREAIALAKVAKVAALRGSTRRQQRRDGRVTGDAVVPGAR